jgi:hypothetical protein
MSILWTIIIGLIVGALAKFVMPGKDPGGIIITILLGIVGARTECEEGSNRNCKHGVFRARSRRFRLHVYELLRLDWINGRERH